MFSGWMDVAHPRTGRLGLGKCGKGPTRNPSLVQESSYKIVSVLRKGVHATFPVGEGGQSDFPPWVRPVRDLGGGKKDRVINRL
jgi:hypothetical protein